MPLRLRFRTNSLKRKFDRAAHVMGPTLVAPAIASATNVGHMTCAARSSFRLRLLIRKRKRSDIGTLLRQLSHCHVTKGRPAFCFTSKTYFL